MSDHSTGILKIGFSLIGIGFILGLAVGMGIHWIR